MDMIWGGISIGFVTGLVVMMIFADWHYGKQVAEHAKASAAMSLIGRITGCTADPELRNGYLSSDIYVRRVQEMALYIEDQEAKIKSYEAATYVAPATISHI